ncbi:MAG: ketol-acid reductoisomerase [bacterium]|nr:ketol-acid reductoisomerase [bacterium]
MVYRAQIVPRLSSNAFAIEDVLMAPGVTEQTIRGGRNMFPLLASAFKGIKQIGVVGWGSQGPAQAQNLRDSLIGTGIRVKVGLQMGSGSCVKANLAGFTEEDGTLGEMFRVIGESDLVLLLISDAAQVEHYKKIFNIMQPGAILGLSHGFLLGYLDTVGERLPGHISVVGVCPKGMGPSVRRLYEQGREINGAGINCSVAVERDLDGRATDVALGWAIAIGSPFTFVTTLRNEMQSDLTGERGVLLGGVHGMLEAHYRYLISEMGRTPEVSFTFSVEALTGAISTAISKGGLLGLSQRFPSGYQKQRFFEAYSAGYRPYHVLMEEIYDEVSNGNEIRSVLGAGRRLQKYPMSTIDQTLMWKTGKKVRSGERSTTLDAPQVVTAGLYVAMMMAQIDIFLEKGHPPSEICNESVIEAVDSLNPYMHARGVAYMIDNCSTTARLGARKWGPRFDHTTMQEVQPNLGVVAIADPALVEAFLGHPIHQALDVCRSMRPPVDIAVV